MVKNSMDINFSNVPQNDAFNVANIKKVQNNNNVSFKGNDVIDTEGSQGVLPSCNHTIVQVHPLVALNMQLLKD